MKSKKLEIVGFNKFDTFLIKIAFWIFEIRKLTISVYKKSDSVNPTSTLFVNGNIGIGK